MGEDRDDESQNSRHDMMNVNSSQKPFSEDFMSDELASNEPTEFHLEKIGGLLTDLKSYLDLPVNFKPRIPENVKGNRQKEQQTKFSRNEEYFLEHSTTELVSALVKVIVEMLMRLQVVSTPEQVPFSISRLLFLASNRSDPNIEKEIFEQFCFESNKIVVEEVNHFQEKVNTFERIQHLLPQFGSDTNLAIKRPSVLDVELVEDSCS